MERTAIQIVDSFLPLCQELALKGADSNLDIKREEIEPLNDYSASVAREGRRII